MAERPSSTSSPTPSLALSAPYTPPSVRQLILPHGGSRYDVEAGWTVLRKNEKPLAEMFSVAYLLGGRTKRPERPITFVFNGGPGAASAFLHVGALGPKRALFGKRGTLPPDPVNLVDNDESWLPFTDLVFVDPIGTGFSRMIDPESAPASPEGAKDKKIDPNEYFQVNRDLDALGEFIERFLSKHHRWGSPVYIAGESYGGYRAAKLARRLPERFGIGLKGCLLISPAIELSVLEFSDYNLVPYINAFPSFAATACVHGKNGASMKDLIEVCERAERFAAQRLPRALVEGAALDGATTRSYAREMAQLCGLSHAHLESLNLRLTPSRFQRDLLRDEQLYCGIYDGSLTSVDPYPDRESFQGPDPTFQGIDRVFTTAANILLRETLGVDTDRSYHLLSEEVYTNWKIDSPRSFMQTELGAMDDLRYALSLSEEMELFISHGYFDLITPYFASRRLIDGVRLPDKARARISFESYLGGHMFYSWDESRKRFTASAKKMYRK